MTRKRLISILLILTMLLSTTLLNASAAAGGDSGGDDGGTATPLGTTTKTYTDTLGYQFRIKATLTVTTTSATASTSFCVVNYGTNDTALDNVKETGKVTASTIILSNTGSSSGDLIGSGSVTGYTGKTYAQVYTKTVVFGSTILSANGTHQLVTASPSSLSASVSTVALG